MILGGWDSSVAAAEIADAHSYHVPMFLAYAWDPDLTKVNYPEVVRIGPNNAILASAFAPFMKRQEYRHVALIADDTGFRPGPWWNDPGHGDARRHRHRVAGVQARRARPSPDAEAGAGPQAAMRS